MKEGRQLRPNVYANFEVSDDLVQKLSA